MSAKMCTNNNTRSEYMRGARKIKKALDAQIQAFDSTSPNSEYEAFAWAFSLRAEFVSKRAHEWVHQYMLDWEPAIYSPKSFEHMKVSLKLGEALAMLAALASAVELDIQKFKQEMREQAQKYSDELVRFQPQFEPSLQNGISLLTAKVMMDQLDEEVKHATLEIGRLSNVRAEAGIAMINVQRLASLRMFFDDEAALVE